MMDDISGLTSSDELLHEVYRLFGIAAHNCACIEYGLAYLLLRPSWAQVEKLDADKVIEIQEKLYKKPLGVLITEIKKRVSLDEKQTIWLKELPDRRNYLIHKFFGKYGPEMNSTQVLAKMKNELVDLIAIFQVGLSGINRSVDMIPPLE